MKKEKPILFSTPMVQAILDGRKSQTRRLIKSRHESGLFQVCRRVSDGKITNIESLDWDERDCEKDILPKYQPGDIMWVRETWRLTDFLHPSDENYGYIYKASENGREWENNDESWIWKPSIHMPKEAARIWLECTGVRVGRVQDISEEDAIAEGVMYYGDESMDYKNYLYDDIHGDDWGVQTAKQSFETLWISINGQESWDSNPWVFVYDFKVLSTTGKPL